MATTLLDNELWELIEPLLPKRTRRYRHPGRRRIDDRRVLSGILFVLTTGIAWQRLPPELGYGSGAHDGRAASSTRTLRPDSMTSRSSSAASPPSAASATNAALTALRGVPTMTWGRP
jgi:Putative transposase of IS4/5 family (DUF4096)